MIGIVGLIAAVGVCLSAQPPAAAPQQTPPRDAARLAAPKTGTARIRGRVGGGDTDAPLRRALLRLASPDSASNAAPRTALTGDDGRFEFRDLPAGRYTMTASKAGYVSLSFGQRRARESGTIIEVGDGQTIEHVDYALPRAAAMAGRIVDEFGEPMASINVQALQRRWVTGQRQLVAAGLASTTPDTGEFRLWGLMPGDYFISARAQGGTADSGGAGYVPSYYPDTVIAGEAQRIALAVGQEQVSLVLTMRPTKFAKLSGTVVDSRGDPSSAGLFLNQLTTSGSISQPFAGTIGPDGLFSIANLAPGDYVIDARGGAAGRAELAMMPVSINGENVEGLTVAMTPGAALHGRIVFDQDESPDLTPANVEIGVTPAPNAPWQRGGNFVRPRADWMFDVPNQLGPKTLVVNVTPLAMSRTWTVKSLVVKDQDVTDAGLAFNGSDISVVVTLTKTMTELSGSVVDSRDKSTGDYTVIAFARERSRWTPLSRYVRTARANQQGAFSIRGLPPADYAVVAVQSHEPGDESDATYLDELQARAMKVTLGTGESKEVKLKIVR